MALNGDDANPETPRAIKLINRMLRPFVAALLPLDPDRLIDAARRRTGLHDFGAGPFREPLRLLVTSLENEAHLNALGRFNARQLLLGLLQTRLRLEELVRRRPEILAETIEAPIIILGMPRTGTTLLQRLLAQDAGLRHLPYWESLMPLPLGDVMLSPPTPDPRIRRAEQGLAFVHYVAPLMISMHEMEAEAPDEEIWLLGLDFATMLFEATFTVPSFGDWFEEADHTRSYLYLRKVLQVLQWYRRGDRWLLKSPQHLCALLPLLHAFPDAVIVQTHRDPVTVTASLASMLAYGRRLSTDHPDPRAIARTWAYRIENMLRRSAEDRPADARRFVDVHFRDLLQDPIDTVRRIYATAHRQLTAATEQAMRAWLAANPSSKHGKHVYRLEDFGLDRDERRAALRSYQERFGVPDE